MIERLSTKELLFRSFDDLSKSTALEKIRVNDITDNCGLKRGTFYYHFSSKEDLVFKKFEEVYSEIHQELYGKQPWKAILERILLFCKTHCTLIKSVLGNADYIRKIQVFMLTSIESIALAYYGPDKLTARVKTEIKFYAIGSAYIYYDWILRDCQEPCEEIAAYINECVPESLRAALDGI